MFVERRVSDTERDMAMFLQLQTIQQNFTMIIIIIYAVALDACTVL